jgi:hypothetical protein
VVTRRIPFGATTLLGVGRGQGGTRSVAKRCLKQRFAPRVSRDNPPVSASQPQEGGHPESTLWQQDALFGKHAAGRGEARGLCLKGCARDKTFYPWMPIARCTPVGLNRRAVFFLPAECPEREPPRGGTTLCLKRASDSQRRLRGSSMQVWNGVPCIVNNRPTRTPSE